MPNDGNRIYSVLNSDATVKYGVSLTGDINPVLGLPVTTSINAAAASDRVNGDSLYKPIPVTTPPNLSPVGKTAAQQEAQRKDFFGQHDYGYTIPTIGIKQVLSESELTAIKNAVWQRQTFGNNHYRTIDLFDGYNHTVRYTGQWGVPQVSAISGTVGFEIQLASGGSPLDMVAPANMVGSHVGPNSNWGVAVYNRYGNSGSYSYGLIAVLAASDSDGNLASSVRLEGNPLKAGDTYVFVPFYTNKTIIQNKGSQTTQNQQITLQSCGLGDSDTVFYCSKYKAAYPSTVETVAVNAVPTYDIEATLHAQSVTGSAIYSNGSAPSYWKIDFVVYQVLTKAPPTTEPGEYPNEETWRELWSGSVNDENPTAYYQNNQQSVPPLPWPNSGTTTAEWLTKRGDYIVIKATAKAPTAKSWTKTQRRNQPPSTPGS